MGRRVSIAFRLWNDSGQSGICQELLRTGGLNCLSAWERFGTGPRQVVEGAGRARVSIAFRLGNDSGRGGPQEGAPVPVRLNCLSAWERFGTTGCSRSRRRGRSCLNCLSAWERFGTNDSIHKYAAAATVVSIAFRLGNDSGPVQSQIFGEGTFTVSQLPFGLGTIRDATSSWTTTDSSRCLNCLSAWERFGTSSTRTWRRISSRCLNCLSAWERFGTSIMTHTFGNGYTSQLPFGLGTIRDMRQQRVRVR